MFRHVYGPHVVVEPRNLPNDARFIFIIDPHESRPPAVQWWLKTYNSLECVLEYPEYQPGRGFEDLEDWPLNIAELCEEFKRIESGVNILDSEGKNHYIQMSSIVGRIMDQHFGSQKRTMGDQKIEVHRAYAAYGINCALSGDEGRYIEFGLDRLKEMLRHGIVKIWSNCKNTQRAFENFGIIKRKTFDGHTKVVYSERFKDFIDDSRYLVTSHHVQGMLDQVYMTDGQRKLAQFKQQESMRVHRSLKSLGSI